MNCFVLNDIREFCLEGLDLPEKLYSDYVPITFRLVIWKVLKCNQILNLVEVDSEKCNDYMEKIKLPILSLEIREEIWNFMLPIYKKLKEYSSTHFKPSEVYLNMTDNGYIKEEIVQVLKSSGAHSWIAYINPTKEKFWVQGDFPFSTFLEKIHNIPEEWWDFHQSKPPLFMDE